jgi:hypothetical protein
VTGQIEKHTVDEVTVDDASLYRTKWLMAHNALHNAVYDPKATLPNVWAAYLSELATAKEKASVPA